MNFGKIKDFYSVAKTGSLTRAAYELNTSQPALSRSIQIFEYQLGCTLFIRYARGLKLTPEGEKVYEFACKFIEEANLIDKTIKSNTLEVNLEIALSPYLSGTWLIKKLKNYLLMHPKVKIKVSDHVDGYQFHDGDIMIGCEVLVPSDAIKHTLLKTYMGLFATKEYLDKVGIPKDIQSLKDHYFISYSDHIKLPYKEKGPWLLKLGHNLYSHLKVSSLEGMIRGASEHLGIVELPCNLKETEESGLIRVLPSLKGPEITLSFFYPPELKEQANICSLKDYLLTAGLI